MYTIRGTSALYPQNPDHTATYFIAHADLTDCAVVDPRNAGSSGNCGFRCSRKELFVSPNSRKRRHEKNCSSEVGTSVWRGGCARKLCVRPPERPASRRDDASARRNPYTRPASRSRRLSCSGLAPAKPTKPPGTGPAGARPTVESLSAERAGV